MKAVMLASRAMDGVNNLIVERREESDPVAL